jgi:hypothetical protein
VKVHVQVAVHVRQGQARGGKALKLGFQLGSQFRLGCATEKVPQANTQRIVGEATIMVHDVRDPVRWKRSPSTSHYHVHSDGKIWSLPRHNYSLGCSIPGHHEAGASENALPVSPDDGRVDAG